MPRLESGSDLPSASPPSSVPNTRLEAPPGARIRPPPAQLPAPAAVFGQSAPSRLPVFRPLAPAFRSSPFPHSKKWRRLYTRLPIATALLPAPPVPSRGRRQAPPRFFRQHKSTIESKLRVYYSSTRTPRRSLTPPACCVHLLRSLHVFSMAYALLASLFCVLVFRKPYRINILRILGLKTTGVGALGSPTAPAVSNHAPTRRNPCQSFGLQTLLGHPSAPRLQSSVCTEAPDDYRHPMTEIRLHNTFSGQTEPFVPQRPGEVGMYTCGPTVYDYAHIGNYRTFVFQDILRRFLKLRGFKLNHVM